MENFCSQGGHFRKICDAYIVSFFKAQDLVLEHLPIEQKDNVKGIELPKEMGVTPELEAKILEKWGDFFAILQLIREEDPNLLAKWEAGQSSPAGADDGASDDQAGDEDQ